MSEKKQAQDFVDAMTGDGWIMLLNSDWHHQKNDITMTTLDALDHWEKTGTTPPPF